MQVMCICFLSLSKVVHHIPQDDDVYIHQEQVELEIKERLGESDLLPPHLGDKENDELS